MQKWREHFSHQCKMTFSRRKNLTLLSCEFAIFASKWKEVRCDMCTERFHSDLDNAVAKQLAVTWRVLSHTISKELSAHFEPRSPLYFLLKWHFRRFYMAIFRVFFQITLHVLLERLNTSLFDIGTFCWSFISIRLLREKKENSRQRRW